MVAALAGEVIGEVAGFIPLDGTTGLVPTGLPGEEAGDGGGCATAIKARAAVQMKVSSDVFILLWVKLYKLEVRRIRRWLSATKALRVQQNFRGSDIFNWDQATFVIRRLSPLGM